MLAKARRDDVVIVTTGPIFPAIGVRLVSLLRRFRYVIDVRDLTPQSLAGGGFIKSQSLAYRMLKRVSDWAYRGAEVAVGVVPEICDYLRGLRGDAVLIPNPIDTDVVKPMSPRERMAFRIAHPSMFNRGITFCYTGNLSRYSGLKTLVLALKKAWEDHFRDWRCLVIGYGEELDGLRKLVDSCGLIDSIAFLPFVPREELVQWIGACDFCYASTIADPAFDMAIDVKILEYLACGKRVVASRSGGFVREMESRGWVAAVRPGDVGLLSVALERVIRHGFGIHHYGSVKFIRHHFGYERYAKQWKEALDEIVS